MKRHIADILSKRTFTVTSFGAIFVMTVVFLIAGRDQLLGVDRWCYQYSHEQSCTGDCPLTCRDDERSCELSRKAACRSHDAEWVSECVPKEGAAAARVSCVDAAP
jgi:hypothetical protein